MRLNTNYKNCDTFITLGFETQLNLFSKTTIKKKKSLLINTPQNFSFKISKKWKKGQKCI